MDGRLLFALAAGAVVAVASWLILRSGERDATQLERALGIAGPADSPARAARASVAAAVGRAFPDAIFEALAGSSPALAADDARRRSVKGLAALLALGAVALAMLNPFWIFAVVLTPRTARLVDELQERRRAQQRRDGLEREVASALDIFVLALEAGLPFDRALRAYADTVQSALSAELAASVRELDVGYRRREALDRLVARTKSARLAELASTVRLAEDFGTPLASALRSLAVDVRAARRQRLQEAALRAPVTMLLPTAGFILLPIFAIVIGPIALRVASGSLF